MPAPLGKHTRMPNGHRPWLDPEPLAKGTIGRTRLESVDRHMTTCLQCPLPTCPHKSCPIPDRDDAKPRVERKGKKTGRTPVPIPEDFARRLSAGERPVDIHADYGVSKTTAYRWKQIIEGAI